MVTKQFEARTLILVLVKGLNAKGEPILVRKSINTLTEEASNEAIKTVADKLAALYQYPLERVCIDEDFILVE